MAASGLPAGPGRRAERGIGVAVGTNYLRGGRVLGLARLIDTVVSTVCGAVSQT